MIPSSHTRPSRTSRIAVIAGGILLAASQAFAQQGDAEKIVKAMSDYVAKQQSISVTYDSDIEVVTRDSQKIQFSSSGQLQLSRPDKLRATRTGGYADVELVFDGKTLSLLGKNLHVFAQAELRGSVAELVEQLRSRMSMDFPGADLISTNAYEALMSDVTDAKHIGHGVVDGVECEHLAFRSAEADWQIWIERGPRPIPRKYVITSKHVNGAPQYTLRIREWKDDAPITADTFAFKAPATAKKVDVSQLPHMDEVPASAPVGGTK